MIRYSHGKRKQARLIAFCAFYKGMEFEYETGRILNSFREALIGKVPDNVIQDNLNYYRNYISSQINSGRREEDVLGSLGDPRLLAKTIEESNKFAMGEERQSYYQDNNTGAYRNQNDDQEQKTGYHKTVNLPGWLLSIIGLALMMLVIVVAFSLISFFAPAILALSLVLLVIHLIRSWQRLILKSMDKKLCRQTDYAK